MANHRGRLIAAKIATLINTIPTGDREYPFLARSARVPRIVKDELGTTTADVTVAALTKSGDEQDRGTELLLYGVTVGVTANVGEPESATANSVEDLVEQVQNFISAEANRVITLEVSAGDLDHTATLELPFENDPIYNLQLLRETGLYQSITVFNYLIEKTRT